MCVMRPIAETTLRKIENSHFLLILKIGKSKKFHQNCYGVKNMGLFLNLNARAPKQMIKLKKNFLKNDKIAIFEEEEEGEKNHKYWRK